MAEAEGLEPTRPCDPAAFEAVSSSGRIASLHLIYNGGACDDHGRDAAEEPQRQEAATGTGGLVPHKQEAEAAYKTREADDTSTESRREVGMQAPHRQDMELRKPDAAVEHKLYNHRVVNRIPKASYSPPTCSRTAQPNSS